MAGFAALVAALQQALELAQRSGTCVHWRLLARSGLNTAQTLQLLRRVAVAPDQVGVAADLVATLEGQVRRAFENLNAILAAARCSFDDVIDVTVFLVNPEQNFAKAWPIVGEYWGQAPYPTLTGMGVSWLYGFQFEIKVIARLPT